MADNESPTPYLILLAINMIVAVGLGLKFYNDLKKENEALIAAHKAAESPNNHEIDISSQATYINRVIPLETFLVNLVDTSDDKMAKIEMQIEVVDPKALKKIDQIKPKLRHALIAILSQQSYSKLSTAKGKDELREQILKELNQLLFEGAVSQVYFTDILLN
jgi:flagellar basal body-associated protein FliL